MQANNVWESLIEECSSRPLTLKTKTGLHFNLQWDGRRLIVTNSDFKPSSKLKGPRSIYKDNFHIVFPYVLRVLNGEKGLSSEITSKTANSVYIISAIRYKLNTSKEKVV